MRLEVWRGMRRAVRLAFVMHRPVLQIVLAAVALVVVAALVIAMQTRAVRSDQLACYRGAEPVVEGSLGSPCAQFDPTLDLLASAASFAKVGALATPFVLGLFLGVPLVAREIEGRTASIAWTLSSSRRRWLVHRAAPVVVVVVLAALLVGFGGEALTRSAPGNEGMDPGFGDYGSRGALVAVRALAELALAIGVGALVPRQLPALLLALGTTIALFAAITLAMDAWMAAEAVPIEVGPAQQGASRIFDMAYREDATGKVISFADYYSDHGGDVGVPEGEEPVGMTMIAYQVPGDRYGGFVMGESAVLGAVAVVSLAVTAAVVSVRRP
jgi:ABC-type transport system involved in multi-copper enzyme maturation permease subunit